MTLDAQLLKILACPEDKGPLYYLEDDQQLFNPRLSRVYEIVEGIPIMLISEAKSLSEDEQSALLAKVEEQGLTPTFEE